MTGSGDDPRSVQPVAAGVADEVRTIIGATTRLADAIRADAERRADETLRGAQEEARRYLEDARREAEALLAAERRRTARAERIVEQSSAVPAELAAVARARRQLDDALDSLGTAVERISRAGIGDEASAPERVTGSAEMNAFGRLRDAREEPPVGDRPIRDEPMRGMSGARLVAAQMALAGSSRAEVAAHLQRTFELPALHEILDEVFDDRGAYTALGESRGDELGAS